MKIENTKAQMRKGILEMCILGMAAENEIYPTDIINQLKESQLIVVEGTLYPILSRLKKANLLNYRWIESSAGPPRKYYTITEEGKSFLEELNQNWTQLVNAVDRSTKKS